MKLQSKQAILNPEVASSVAAGIARLATFKRSRVLMHRSLVAKRGRLVYGDFEWDDAKAATNLVKHGISFEEAVTAVVDPNALFLADDSGHSTRFSGWIRANEISR